MKQLKNKTSGLRAVLFFLMCASLSVAAFFANAQGANDALDKPFGDVTDMGALTNTIFQFGIGVCVLAASIYIAIGAFYYFVGAGSNAKRAEEGKTIIERAIIGLVLALVSWILLNTIHPQFTNLDVPAYKDTSTSGGS